MLKHLFHIWTMLLFPCFAAGAAIADTLGGGVSDGTTSGDDLGTTDTGAGETGGETPGEAVGEVPAGDEELAAATEQTGDGRTLSPAIRTVLANLKASNPEAAKQLKGLIFSEQAFRQAFPQGPTQAKELMQKLDEFGGLEGVGEKIQTFEQEVGEYRELDQQWINGDPAFIKEAVGKYPDGFKKLMPSMLQEYAKVDGEGYQRELSGIMVATLQSAGFDNSLWMLKRILGQTQDANAKEALNIIGELEKWRGQLNDIASKAPTLTNDPKAQELTQREQAIQKQERDSFLGGIGNEFHAFSTQKINAELGQIAKGKTFSEGAKTRLNKAIVEEVAGILGKDAGFNSKYDAYCNAKDKNGALKLLKSRAEQLLPNATKKIYQEFYGTTTLGTKKPVVPGTGKPGTVAPQGWAKIAGPPKPELVDHAKTTMSMKYDGQAYLKDGRKVWWGEKAPK